ncbi:MAG TPA: DUF4251 domain-containing protein, partial [Bacteroidales bacterium]|nr:DUF4251 domain-containing protein [Bacteroidales bacterium]
YGGVGYGGSDSGLHFKGKPDDFTVEKNRKANYQVTVNVSESTDNFRLFLTVSFDGSASLSISSNNRESISYVGEITAPERENN